MEVILHWGEIGFGLSVGLFIAVAIACCIIAQ